ncbi:hypothetical protein C449_10928 [Halococcus saccharolyticus DSM 5350]|uniref:Uncharacterized protein n=1 Tax=Halococcus saccharolyticus DSM 5350 TaxID=1227455 RepID=M0MH80_9EURY|nr:hypothetical protein C449_10928 [Halococcus saccharolyticus DSM 5350]
MGSMGVGRQSRRYSAAPVDEGERLDAVAVRERGTEFGAVSPTSTTSRKSRDGRKARPTRAKSL